MAADRPLSLPNVARRPLFLFWGRRGALSRFSLDLMTASLSVDGVDPILSLSRQNELWDEAKAFGRHAVPVETFLRAGGALNALRVVTAARATLRLIEQSGRDAVIILMPHVWHPLIIRAIRRTGVRTAVIVHDARPHPGEPGAALHGWGLQVARSADVVLTLSHAVARQLASDKRIPPARLRTLFHPDLNYGTAVRPVAPKSTQPFRVLFFGRILAYKGLLGLVAAIEQLRGEGRLVELSVHGAGDCGKALPGLMRIGAEVENRWIRDRDVGSILARHHLVALSHIEASQSGVVAAAHGMGIPVVVTPVGGLPEQVRDGLTGMIAVNSTGPALAAAIRRLLDSPGEYEAICSAITSTRSARSMDLFSRSLLAAVMPSP